MNSNQKGAARERKVRDLLREDGYVVLRAAGSLGGIDLIALKAGKPVLFIEVKGNKGSPYLNFREKERQTLREQAEQAGAEAFLAHWPPRAREPTWVPAVKWP